jgi:uncharacterized membrane protein
MSNVRLPIDLKKVYAVAEQKGVDKEDVAVLVRDWMKKVVMDEYRSFIMFFWYAGAWWARLSGQVYLDMADFEWAGEKLGVVCERVERGEWASEA